jgi:hypothetical protein
MISSFSPDTPRTSAHCVILLEDVDVASQNRSQDKEVEHSDSMPSFSEKQGKEVTFSGLLNILDGVGS